MNANEKVSCGGAGRAALPFDMPSPVSRLAPSAPNWANAWRFPFGTNEYDSAWAFSWGKLRFALGDAIERGRDGLSPGANEAAYCWIEVRPRWNSWIEFYGDAPSDLEDPCFWAKAGETYRETLLIGKTYEVECSRAVEVVAWSDDYCCGVWGDGTNFTYACDNTCRTRN